MSTKLPSLRIRHPNPLEFGVEEVTRGEHFRDIAREIVAIVHGCAGGERRERVYAVWRLRLPREFQIPRLREVSFINQHGCTGRTLQDLLDGFTLHRRAGWVCWDSR
jgi:hypothetical protein